MRYGEIERGAERENKLGWRKKGLEVRQKKVAI